MTLNAKTTNILLGEEAGHAPQSCPAHVLVHCASFRLLHNHRCYEPKGALTWCSLGLLGVAASFLLFLGFVFWCCSSSVRLHGLELRAHGWSETRLPHAWYGTRQISGSELSFLVRHLDAGSDRYAFSFTPI